MRQQKPEGKNEKYFAQVLLSAILNISRDYRSGRVRVRLAGANIFTNAYRNRYFQPDPDSDGHSYGDVNANNIADPKRHDIADANSNTYDITYAYTDHDQRHYRPNRR